MQSARALFCHIPETISCARPARAQNEAARRGSGYRLSFIYSAADQAAWGGRTPRRSPPCSCQPSLTLNVLGWQFHSNNSQNSPEQQKIHVTAPYLYSLNLKAEAMRLFTFKTVQSFCYFYLVKRKCSLKWS